MLEEKTPLMDYERLFRRLSEIGDCRYFSRAVYEKKAKDQPPSVVSEIIRIKKDSWFGWYRPSGFMTVQSGCDSESRYEQVQLDMGGFNTNYGKLPSFNIRMKVTKGEHIYVVTRETTLKGTRFSKKPQLYSRLEEALPSSCFIPEEISSIPSPATIFLSLIKA